jgi:hypothetical protein
VTCDFGEARLRRRRDVHGDEGDEICAWRGFVRRATIELFFRWSRYVIFHPAVYLLETTTIGI